jgi:segregation and condensation protein B
MTDQIPEAQAGQREDHDPEGPPQARACEAGSSAEQTPVPRQKLAALEAVLFMAAEPLAPSELSEILEVSLSEVEALAGQLERECAGRGVQVMRVAGGYQFCTRPEHGPSVAKLHKPERFRLSRAALETLAIIAYKQPVTRPEIDAIRGVNSDSALDTLCQYGIACEAGRKDAPGRPLLYCTTEDFLGKFGLDSVADLPSLDSVPVDEAAATREVEEAVGPGAEAEPPGGQPQQDARPEQAPEEGLDEEPDNGLEDGLENAEGQREV